MFNLKNIIVGISCRMKCCGEDLGRLLLGFSEHFGRLGRAAFRGRRTHGEFIAHQGFISQNRSGHKSVINNSRRARFVAAYEICLVTGFSVAPPGQGEKDLSSLFFFFFGNGTAKRWYTWEWREEGNGGGREGRSGISAIRSFVDDTPTAGEGTTRRDRRRWGRGGSYLSFSAL